MLARRRGSVEVTLFEAAEITALCLLRVEVLSSLEAGAIEKSFRLRRFESLQEIPILRIARECMVAY